MIYYKSTTDQIYEWLLNYVELNDHPFSLKDVWSHSDFTQGQVAKAFKHLKDDKVILYRDYIRKYVFTGIKR